MPLHAVSIREASGSDAAAIAATMRRRIPELDYGSDEMVDAWIVASYSEAAVARRIESAAFYTAVAEDGGVFAGSAYIDLRDAYIGGFGVALDGRGAGRALLRRLVAMGGHREMTMSVAVTNERMIGLAASSGFVIHGIDPDTSWFTQTSSSF